MTTATIGDTRQATATARHWIDGRWRDSAQHQDSINPATGEVIGTYALAGEDEAREATAAALRTFRETDWKHDRALRARVLDEMAGRFEARAHDLAQLLSLENGKVGPEATFEVGQAAPALRYYGALVRTEYGRAAEWAPGRFSLLVREANRCRRHQRAVELPGGPVDSLARPGARGRLHDRREDAGPDRAAQRPDE